MVNVVAPRNSVPAILNVAMTLSELKAENKGARTQFVSEDQTSQFWNKLPSYVDKRDMSLIVLDMPHPGSDELQKIPLEPWKHAIIYLHSELNPLNSEEKEIMLNRGITVIPPRKVSESFLGDVSTRNTKWVRISRILSMEETEGISKEELDIAKGIITKATSAPEETVQRVLNDEIEYFRDIGKKRTGKIDFKLAFPNNRFCVVETKRMTPHIYSDLFEVYARNNAEPLAIVGAMNGIFTNKPTLYKYLGATNLAPRLRFGRGAIVSIDGDADNQFVGYVVGLGDRSPLVVKIAPPRFVSRKTLLRRLLGGKTNQRVRKKVYHKSYKSLADRFDNLEQLANDVFLIPPEAFENTVAILHESGADYSVLTVNKKKVTYQNSNRR
ncbi:MAG: hypothetical protein LYZ70_01610 [Nitrososphaerales archaeon]|nr:hypothetical protein [Nitrososphaerales archaeon]